MFLKNSLFVHALLQSAARLSFREGGWVQDTFVNLDILGLLSNQAMLMFYLYLLLSALCKVVSLEDMCHYS